MKVAVLGAGISGLSTAWGLHKQGAEVTLFEGSGRAGGAIGSVRRDGYVAEHGPHTLLNSQAAVDDLIDDLGLTHKRQWASPNATRRYTVKDGTVVALPASPPDFFKSPLFSGQAKLALAREPFIAPRGDDLDESVTSFVKRRLGEEFLNYGVDLLVNGIWAGDPNRLSMRHAFKKMWALEAAKGSIFKGGFALSQDKTRRKDATKIFAFEGGNQTLVDALAERTSPILHADVKMIAPLKAGWRVTARVDGKLRKFEFDAVVSTLGVRNLVGVFPAEEIRFAAQRLAYPSVSVTTFGFRRDEVDHPLDGFGMLVPDVEHRDILGVMFTSSLFEGRAPSGHVTMAVFVGGMRHGEKACMDVESKHAMILRELRDLLGVRGLPTFVEDQVWPTAIPQYEVGHGDVLVAMQAVEAKNPGLYVSGNFRNAVAVPDLVAQGVLVARQISARYST